MLDFNQVAVQMATFTRDQSQSADLLRAALTEAANRLEAAGPHWETVRERIVGSHTSWLMPAWRERPDGAFPAVQTLPPYTAVASDGSHIVADRHDLALCYLINVGFVTLRYGETPSAALRSRPTLATPDDSLLSEYRGDQDPIAPKRLSMHCRLRELEGLAELIEQEVAGGSATAQMTAFCDGSLILWPLETEKDDNYRKSVLSEFEGFLDTGRSNGVPIVGYISKPMSKDVVNSLNVSVCPHAVANCDRNCPGSSLPRLAYKPPDCSGTERVTDAELFSRILKPGERSAVFESGSNILKRYSDRHKILFFYLHTGREIARVELPAWAAGDADLLSRAHAMCWDQACKGDGYPVVLAEAHEQAIVRGAERAAFFHLMERHFVAGGLPVATTQKALSKRARRV